MSAVHQSWVSMRTERYGSRGRRERLTSSKSLNSATHVHPMCTPVMGISLWGAILCWISPLCETGSLKEISIPNDNSDWQSTRRKQLRWGDPGWEGSWSQNCEVTNRNVLQGRIGQASEHNITKPFPDDRSGKGRACAAKIHVLIRGDLHRRLASRRRSSN